MDRAQAPAAGDRTWRQALRQLDNILASIQSSLDLALANEGRPEARPFLLLAQETASKGTGVINELSLQITEPSGSHPEQWPAAPGPAGQMPHKAAAPVLSLDGSERILLAEDEPSISMLIEAILGCRGYQVVGACNGEEAVCKYRQEGPFDLVILDLRMPKLDGWGALEQIRALNPAARALALSGLPFEQEGITAKRAGGFDGQLCKPFDNDELVNVVRQVLDLKKPR